MANYKTKSKVNGKPIITAIIAFIMAGVLAAGVCCLGFASRNADGKWFGNFKNMSTWHWSDKIDEQDKDNNGGDNKDPNDGKKPDDGGDNKGTGGSEIGEVINNGVRVLCAEIPRAAYAANGVSERAENAYTLTAEVLPDYATDKTLNWSVSWLHGDSAFASGKNVTDYVTLTPAADGANTAVCACLQDFGETIVITASSRANPLVSGVCYVQYYQRVKSCDFVFHFDGEEITPTVSDGVYKVDYTGSTNDYTVELKPVYSNYTLTDEYTTTISGSLSSTFGYTATENLNTIKIPAGLSGGDPELTENALNWCNYVNSQVFSINWNIEYVQIGRLLCLGQSQNVHGNYIKPTYKLTDTEKLHPRCSYYLSVLENADNFTNESNWTAAKNTFNNYVPSAYSFAGGAVVDSYNDFVSAVKKCNTAKVGVIQYTIAIDGAHSNYQTVLNLGYNDEFKINVESVNLSNTEIVF